MLSDSRQYTYLLYEQPSTLDKPSDPINRDKTSIPDLEKKLKIGDKPVGANKFNVDKSIISSFIILTDIKIIN